MWHRPLPPHYTAWKYSQGIVHGCWGVVAASSSRSRCAEYGPIKSKIAAMPCDEWDSKALDWLPDSTNLHHAVVRESRTRRWLASASISCGWVGAIFLCLCAFQLCAIWPTVSPVDAASSPYIAQAVYGRRTSHAPHRWALERQLVGYLHRIHIHALWAWSFRDNRCNIERDNPCHMGSVAQNNVEWCRWIGQPPRSCCVASYGRI